MGLKEPFNSISHMVGGGLSIAGTLLLLWLADAPREYVAASAYGFGLVALAGAGNYRTQMTEAVEDHDVFDGEACTAGCLLSLLGGVLALSVGLLALALHVLMPPRKMHLKSVRPT